VAGYLASNPGDYWDAMAESAAKSDLSMECSSAGWTKPIAEQYRRRLPRPSRRAGLTFTTASDAHSLERVGSRAGELADLLEARGVHEVAAYTNRQRQMIPLRAS